MQRGGDNFKHDFVLHALTTLLCSMSSLDASLKILHSLVDVNKVKEFNWAQYIFKCIQKAISPRWEKRKRKDQKKKKTKSYKNGCLYFLHMWLYEKLIKYSLPCFLCFYTKLHMLMGKIHVTYSIFWTYFNKTFWGTWWSAQEEVYPTTFNMGPRQTQQNNETNKECRGLGQHLGIFYNIYSNVA